MGAFSSVHWVIVFLMLAILGVPFWRIVKRTGMPAALSLLWFVPLVNLVFLWVFAFARWPAMERQQGDTTRQS
jgi:O-antigen ligase